MSLLEIRDDNGQVYEIVALKGDKGDDGHTPQKGVDYYTPDEKAALVSELNAVDQVFDLDSPNAIANRVVAQEMQTLRNSYEDYGVQLYHEFERMTEEVLSQFGDIETALDSIIAIQEALIGGESV